MDEVTVNGCNGDWVDVVDVEELPFGLDCGKWRSTTDQRRSLPGRQRDQSDGAVPVVQSVRSS